MCDLCFAVLERLEAKSCVTRDRTEAVHVFAAAIGRDELIKRRLREVAESLCEGSITPFLTLAAGSNHLTTKQRQILHDLIEDLDEPTCGRNAKGKQR